MILANGPHTPHISTPTSCECGRSVYEGLPCVHTLRDIKEMVGDDYQNWPFEFISAWIIQKPEDVIIHADLDGRVAAGNEVDLPEAELTEEDVVVEVDKIECSDSQHQVGTDDLSHMWIQDLYLQTYRKSKT